MVLKIKIFYIYNYRFGLGEDDFSTERRIKSTELLECNKFKINHNEDCMPEVFINDVQYLEHLHPNSEKYNMISFSINGDTHEFGFKDFDKGIETELSKYHTGRY